jgi:hypothetical protein
MSDLEERCESVAATIVKYVEQIMDGRLPPTVNETPIGEYPKEIVDERGKQFAVVICTGGPHIEVAANGIDGPARLKGHWRGHRCTINGDQFDPFLDYFINRAHSEQ